MSLALLGLALAAADAVQADLPYRPELTDAYAQERCRLDVLIPSGARSFPVVVWLHGGGLEGGSKSIPERLKGQGIGVVAANYRLTPKVSARTCIEDAAAAIAWTVKNTGRLGGSDRKVFVSGHSAGAYLASMAALDPRWLAPHGIDPNQLAGLVSFSGHSITHFAVRKEMGMKDTQPLVDDLAPLYHVRADAPPILLLSGDREMELLGRYEESAYFWRMLKAAGHPRVELRELQGFDHGGMVEPGLPLLLRLLKERSREIDSSAGR